MRLGVTFEDVAAAAQQLRNEGLRPSLRSVRSVLGTGSLTTIQAHLGRWTESEAVASAQVPAAPVVLAPEIERAILADTTRRTREATETLQMELAEARETIALLTKESGEVQAELEKAKVEAVRLSEERDRIKGRLEVVEPEVVRLRRELEELQRERGAEKIALAVAQTRASELEKGSETLQKLIATLRLPLVPVPDSKPPSS